MNRQDIIRLAIESGVADKDLSGPDSAVTDYGDATDDLVKFAALVAADMREKCAKFAERAGFSDLAFDIRNEADL